MASIAATITAVLIVASPGSQVAPPAAPPVTPATANYPDDPRLDLALGMMKKGAFDAAVTTAGTVLRANPSIDRAHAILGIALNKQKKYAEARTELEKAEASGQEFPEHRHVPHFLGWSCYHLGDLEAARRAFTEHLRRVPGEPDSTFGLGLVALGEDNLDEADAQFAKALEGFTKPTPQPTDQARVLTRMSDVALRRGDVGKAEELLERAIKANALQHETWAKLARVKDRLGKQAEADAARANEQRILEKVRRPVVPTTPSNPPSNTPADTPPADAPREKP